MIVEYEDSGLPTHVIRDPVYPGIAEAMAAAGAQFLEFPPVYEMEQNEDGTESPKSVTYTEFDITADYITPDKQVAKRPRFELPEEVNIPLGTSQTFSVPIGTNIRTSEGVFTVDDGSLELEGDMVAEYHLAITHGVHVTHYMKVSVYETVSG